MQTYFFDKYPANGRTIISEQNIFSRFILKDMHSEVLTEEQRNLLPLLRVIPQRPKVEDTARMIPSLYEEVFSEKIYGRIYRGADGEYPGGIQVAKRNVHINKTIQIFFREVQKKYSIMGAYFYGSHAKGTSHKWSDIDLAIISPDFSEDLFEDRLHLKQCYQC